MATTTKKPKPKGKPINWCKRAAELSKKVDNDKDLANDKSTILNHVKRIGETLQSWDKEGREELVKWLEEEFDIKVSSFDYDSSPEENDDDDDDDDC